MFENNITWFFKFVVVGIFFAVLGYCINLKPRLAWVSFIPFGVYSFLLIYHLIILMCVKAI